MRSISTDITTSLRDPDFSESNVVAISVDDRRLIKQMEDLEASEALNKSTE
jgi:hypothetical protein